MNGVEAGTLIQQLVAATVVFVSANAEVLKQPHIVRKPFSRATVSSTSAVALAARQDIAAVHRVLLPVHGHYSAACALGRKMTIEWRHRGHLLLMLAKCAPEKRGI
jgi:hypothetical protein